MIKVSGKNPVSVSKELYNQLEQDMEDHWNSLPWKRIVRDSQRGTYQNVIDRFSLVIYSDYESKLQVSLVSKEDNETVTFNKTYWMD